MSYNAGIIGAGGVAGMGLLGTHEVGKRRVQASHAGGYEDTDGIELTAIADIDRQKLDRFGDLWEIPADHRYEDHRKMLASEPLDCVSIATPTYLHRDHVLDACEYGSAEVLWCEKPIATRISDAEEMIDACNEADIDLLINHTLRFTDKIVDLRTRLQRDELIGSIRSVTAVFRMELLRNSTHLLDTLIYLLDTRASEVAGYITGENEAANALDAPITVDDAGGGGFVWTDDDTFVTIDCTLPREMSSMYFQFIGTNGKLYLNNDDGEWRFWQLEDGDHIESSIPGISGSWTWDDDYASGFPNAAAHIVYLLDGTATNRSSGEDAIRSLEIIIAFYLSHYTGGRVEIPLAHPMRSLEVTSW